MENQNVITKSNHLIEAGYKLSLNEQRLVLSGISKIDSRKGIPEKIKITAKEFSDQYNLPMNKSYETLLEAADKLYERDIQMNDERYNTRIRWLSSRSYARGEGYVSLSFSREVSTYLTKLKKEFTSYKASLIRNLKSPYSIRLFELLIRWKNTGRYIVKLQDFKTNLELDGKYDRFTNLRKRVIDPSIKELKDNCGMIIECTPIKNGRTIESLEFKFHTSKQQLLEL